MTDPISRYWASGDGLSLHAADYPAAGARLPVVCLHGLTRNAKDFDQLGPWLAARGRRALALDIRGRGRSARDPAADYRIAAYARDVAGLLDALDIPRAIFVGTSMGGLITMELAAVRPELIAAAIINDVGPELSPVGLARIAGYAGKATPVTDWASAADYVRTINQSALPHYGDADWAAMARRLFVEQANGAIVADYDPAIATAFTREPIVTDPWARWEALARDRPLLLLRGAISDLLDPQVAAKMVAGHGRATLVEVADVGHAPMLDEPDARAAIGAFLAPLP